MSRANVVFSVLSLLDCHSHVFIFNGQKDLKHSEIERGREEGCRGGNNKKCWCWLLYCYIVSMYNIYLLGRSVYGMRLLKDREGLKRTTSAKRRNFLMCSRKLVLPLLMAHLKNEKSTRPTMATTTEIIKIPTTTYANRKNGIPNNNGKLDISCSENGEN